MATKGAAVPPMHPRERLTEKALQGISTYASVRAGDLPIHYMMVRYVLEAERMPRERLYAWLEAHGYQWRPKAGLWVQQPGKSAGGQGQQAEQVQR